MKRYQIYCTTDDKFIGKIFTINENTKIIDIIDEILSPELQTYSCIEKIPAGIKISNSNYTIKGKLI